MQWSTHILLLDDMSPKEALLAGRSFSHYSQMVAAVHASCQCEALDYFRERKTNGEKLNHEWETLVKGAMSRKIVASKLANLRNPV